MSVLDRIRAAGGIPPDVAGWLVPVAAIALVVVAVVVAAIVYRWATR